MAFHSKCQTVKMTWTLWTITILKDQQCSQRKMARKPQTTSSLQAVKRSKDFGISHAVYLTKLLELNRKSHVQLSNESGAIPVQANLNSCEGLHFCGAKRDSRDTFGNKLKQNLSLPCSQGLTTSQTEHTPARNVKNVGPKLEVLSI